MTVSSGIFTPATGFTVFTQHAIVWGKLVTIRIDVKSSNALSIQANGGLSTGNTQIGTVAAAYAPASISFFGGSYQQTTGHPFWYVGSGREVYLTGFDSTGAARTFAAGNGVLLTATYVTA